MIAVGIFTGTLDLDLGPDEHMLTPGTGLNSGFVTAIGADGTMEWARAIGGTQTTSIEDAHINSDGTIVLVGAFRGTVDLNPSPTEEFLVTGGSDWDIFFVKLTAEGDFVWGFRLGNTWDDLAYTTTLDAAGNLLVGLRARGNLDLDPGPATVMVNGGVDGVGVIMQYSPDGAYQWHRFTGPAPDLVAVLANGDIVTAHGFVDMAEIGEAPNSITVGSVGAGNVRACVRWDVQVQPQQVVTFQGMCQNTAHVAPDGSLTLVGTCTGIFDMDPGPGENLHTTNGVADVFALQLNAQWEAKWGFGWGDSSVDQVKDFDVDGFGNVYIVAPLFTPYDVDPGPGEIILDPGVSFNAYLLILDAADGAVRSAARLMNSSTGYIETHGVAVTRNGTILSHGEFRATAPLDPWTNSDSLTVQVHPSGELFLCAFTQEIGLGTSSITEAVRPMLYPLPCVERLFIDALERPARYRVLDAVGREVRNGTLPSGIASVDVAMLPAGAYHLHMEDGQATRVMRFLKK